MSNGLNPPFPASEASGNIDGDTEPASSGSQKSQEQQFLNLVRLVGKENDPSAYDEHMENLVALMNSMIALYNRRGLLQGNVDKANRILSATSTTNNKKRGSGKKVTSTSAPQVSIGEDGSVGSDASVTETLVFTALTRILSDSKDSYLSATANSPLDKSSDSALLVALATEMCVAMSQSIQTNRDNSSTGDSSCAMAEYELLARHGKPILNGIVAKLNVMQVDLRNDLTRRGGNPSQQLRNCFAMATCLDDEKHTEPMFSCLRASCSLINLFGTKLSRNVALLTDLKTCAWQCLTIPRDQIQEAAARLLAALPLAGGTDRKVPAELCNTGVVDMVIMINRFVDTAASVSKSAYQGASPSEESNVILEAWISFLRREISEDQDRATAFRLLLRGLVLTLQHFLSRDIYGHNPSVLVEARVDMGIILDTLEKFLSYPMSAESLFFRTKKRLRDEIVDNGLLSCRIIVTQVANDIKSMGHDMLDFVVSSIGGPLLLVFAKRIIRMSYASLLTSCSGPVRKVMDPSSAVQLEGKRRRWLHLSMPLRIKAVKTTHLVAVAFGSDRTAKLESSEQSAGSKSDGEIALNLVAASLIEQLISSSASEDTEDTWGTTEERVELMIACLDCLRGALASSNGFMGTITRHIVDSMVITCLDRRVSASLDLVGWSSVQCAMFRLASTCVATPWNDGSTTAIITDLKRVALQATMEQDETVSLAAKDALRVCDLFGTPRAPPLLIVRRDEIVGQNAEISAPQILEKIQTAHVDAAKCRATAAEAERVKTQEKRRREAEKQESTKRKREAQGGNSSGTATNGPAGDAQGKSDEALKEEKVSNLTPTNPHILDVQTRKTVDKSSSMEVDMAANGKDNDGKEGQDQDESSVDDKPCTSKIMEKSEEDDEEDMEDFPDIVGGGPDSDDD